MSKANARNSSTFNADHNKAVVIPNRIRAVLADLSKRGPEHYEYEADIVKLAKLSQTEISRFREGFRPHIVEIKYKDGKALSTPKNVWFHNVSVARRMREQLAKSERGE